MTHLVLVAFSVMVLLIFPNHHLRAEPSPNLSLPNPELRRSMMQKLAEELVRIDGEGLIPRSNRPETWENTIKKLSEEAQEASSLYDLGRAFKRLDATYPNLHAKVFLMPELDEKESLGSITFPIQLFPAEVNRNHQKSKFRVVVSKNAKTEFKNGDELIAINSRPIQDWTDENFIFCKFPLREQCEVEFFDNLKNELLSWGRRDPLTLTIKRNGREMTFPLNPEIKAKVEPNENANLPCGVSPERYKEFSLAYEGANLCAFESRKNSGVVALRIRSFVYQDMAFSDLNGEVQIFWKNYWRKKSSSVNTLIIDIIGNYGGQSPIPYYALFFAKPYQEQYVQFKKIDEFEEKQVLESLFWGDKGKEIWFENVKKNGSFDRTSIGSFLDHIPQFCADSKKDCREGLFEPRKHGFKGRVKLLMNHWCVSSCVGFVYNIKNLLKDRVQTYGIPDSGDSAYSRLTVMISPQDGKKVVSKIAPLKKARNPDKPEYWVRQVAAVTRSTDSEGNVISGRPQKIDYWVPRKWNQSEDQWAASVFKEALLN